MRTIAQLWGGPQRLSSQRGIAAAALVVVAAISAAATSTNPADTLIALLILSPVLWWAAWTVIGVLESVWIGLVAGQPPTITVGRAWQPSSTRKQLREDANARVFVDRGGILLRRRMWFLATGTPPIRLHPGTYLDACRLHDQQPCQIAAYRDRIYWWYRDHFYWTNNHDYAAQDVKALLFARERQHQRQLEHAHAVMAASQSPAARKRIPIPQDVKRAVFERDQGCCVQCDSSFEIQYDHIIPFSMGGATTIENLQLLCARCNQQKGGRL